eukprot:2793246-Prymnesium_polylepis.1
MAHMASTLKSRKSTKGGCGPNGDIHTRSTIFLPPERRRHRDQVGFSRSKPERPSGHEEHGAAPDVPGAADVGVHKRFFVALEHPILGDRRPRGVVGAQHAHDARPEALDDEKDLDESGHLEVGCEDAIMGVDHGCCCSAHRAAHERVLMFESF